MRAVLLMFVVAGVLSPVGAQTSNTSTTAIPAAASSFLKFNPVVRTSWDTQFLTVESLGWPAHPMMVGIKTWNQQVPIPQSYTGANAFRIPLKPSVSVTPVSCKNECFRGAIAVAANGIPIFNPIKQDGRTDTFLAGELDQYGGHTGRANDYHYHIAPLHLQQVTGVDAPIAYALDGYPVFGLVEPDGSPARNLDSFNGHEGSGGYHYHATPGYPYVNGGFHGEVTVRGGQVDPQPRTQNFPGIEPPVQIDRFTSFTQALPSMCTLQFRSGNALGEITWAGDVTGNYAFKILEPGREPRSTTLRAGPGDRNSNRRPPPRPL